jgi:ABC-2 type transport system permease protein
VVLGKCLGAASVALVQSVLFLALAPLSGFDAAVIDWPVLVLALALGCCSLCALGFGVAWWLDSTAGYHVVMSLLLLPMWIVSGAMFPSSGAGVLSAIQHYNPLSYAVGAVRRALYGGSLPGGTGVAAASTALELCVLLGFALFASAFALAICHRRR